MPRSYLGIFSWQAYRRWGREVRHDRSLSALFISSPGKLRAFSCRWKWRVICFCNFNRSEALRIAWRAAFASWSICEFHSAYLTTFLPLFALILATCTISVWVFTFSLVIFVSGNIIRRVFVICDAPQRYRKWNRSTLISIMGNF